MYKTFIKTFYKSENNFIKILLTSAGRQQSAGSVGRSWAQGVSGPKVAQ
jgi:hypothetical protein